MNNQALFNRTYACTHFAADRLSTVMVLLDNRPEMAELGYKTKGEALTALWPDVLGELRKAVAAAESLQRQLVGVPEPRRGD